MTIAWTGHGIESVPTGVSTGNVPGASAPQAVPIGAVTFNVITKTNYDLAVENGFVGTLQQYLDSLTRVVYIHTQSAPAATWTISNPFNRLCGVTVLIDGEVAFTDVSVTNLNVVVAFTSPQSGTAVLT